MCWWARQGTGLPFATAMHSGWGRTRTSDMIDLRILGRTASVDPLCRLSYPSIRLSESDAQGSHLTRQAYEARPSTGPLPMVQATRCIKGDAACRPDGPSRTSPGLRLDDARVGYASVRLGPCRILPRDFPAPAEGKRPPGLEPGTTLLGRVVMPFHHGSNTTSITACPTRVHSPDGENHSRRGRSVCATGKVDAKQKGQGALSRPLPSPLEKRYTRTAASRE